MAKFAAQFEIDDTELEAAIKFLGSSEENVRPIKEDYFTGYLRIDVRKIQDTQKRYYHTNGLVAMLMTIQDEIDNACKE